MSKKYSTKKTRTVTQEVDTKTKTWLTLKECAYHLGVSKETIYRLLYSNKIPAHKIGKLWRFSTTEVDKAALRGKLGSV